MATLKLAITPDKVAKDGSHKIRIALGHKTVTRYIVTRFKIDNLSQFKDGQVVKRPDASIINSKLRNILNEYQDKLDQTPNTHLYNCGQLRSILVNKSKEQTGASTFQEMAASYISELKKGNRDNYAALHEINNRYFTEFSKGIFLLSEITPEIINNYARFLRNKKNLSDASIGIMMRNVRTIINKAQKTGLVKYEINPFAFYSIKSAPEREIDITIDNLIKIRDSNPKEKHLRMARDIFMLSFYLGGINLIDLLDIDFRSKDTICYTRTKSKTMKQGEKNVVIPILKESREIIDRWISNRTGKLDFGYKFTYSNFSRYLTRCITKLAKNLNVNQRVIFYSARKTFAQFASELGIPDGVIDYCLGHSTKSRGIIRYYTKVREKQAKIAISRVIEYTNDPDKYKEYIEMKADIMMMKTF